MDLQLAGKVALVTAASKGLGKATARQLAYEGARIAICARSPAVDQAAAELGRETGAEPLALRADLTRQEDIDSLVQSTLDRFGQIDILIINAGGPPSGNFLDLTPDHWSRAAELTLMSAVRLCYAVVPHMLDRESGSIVAIESISVKQPIDNLILSNSLRMAVIGMLKSMANELGPRGIRINSINPTFTWTGRVEQLLTDRAAKNKSSIQEETAKVAANIPLRRMGLVEEFGQAAAWLASPAASFIHGHALMFDGGMTGAPL
ncbi:MAG: SDR family oxidoreductase [Chloroflexota bacterium]|nr:MAG: SDR family oxidoreductase [Chloroflexota bacterium]